MISKIVFYNHYHNGDIFISKEYIRNIMSALPDFEYEYYHPNSPKLLLDLNIKTLPITSVNLPMQVQGFIYDNIIYINTWIGASGYNLKGCNFSAYNEMWFHIYKTISELVDKDISFNDEYYFIPETDYSYYDIPTNLNIDYDNTIVFSNGYVNSNQSNFQETDFIVEELLNTFKDKTIILTKKINIFDDRILYTDDIIKTSNGDLNEISWFAEKSKHLIGRYSGPFIFMHTKNVLNNPSKNIIGFGNSEIDNLIYKLDIPASNTHIYDSDRQLLVEKIIKNIESS